MIDKQGNEIIPCLYEDYFAFIGENQYAIVKQAGLYGIINSEGNEVVPCEYQRIGIPVSGLCQVKQNDKWGMLWIN